MLLALALAAASPSVEAKALSATIPKPAIVLLWADWCAPCREEVRALPMLSASVAPVPVIIVAVDANARARALLTRVVPAQKRFWPGSTTALLRHWSIEATGLPFAIALDASGRACATATGGATPAKLRGLLDECAQPNR